MLTNQPCCHPHHATCGIQIQGRSFRIAYQQADKFNSQRQKKAEQDQAKNIFRKKKGGKGTGAPREWHRRDSDFAAVEAAHTAHALDSTFIHVASFKVLVDICEVIF